MSSSAPVAPWEVSPRVIFTCSVTLLSLWILPPTAAVLFVLLPLLLHAESTRGPTLQARFDEWRKLKELERTDMAEDDLKGGVLMQGDMALVVDHGHSSAGSEGGEGGASSPSSGSTSEDGAGAGDKNARRENDEERSGVLTSRRFLAFARGTRIGGDGAPSQSNNKSNTNSEGSAAPSARPLESVKLEDIYTVAVGDAERSLQHHIVLTLMSGAIYRLRTKTPAEALGWVRAITKARDSVYRRGHGAGGFHSTLRDPSREPGKWFSAVLDAFWSVSESWISESLAASLASNLNWYKPESIQTIRFESFSLGPSAPPMFDFVAHATDRADTIKLDFSTELLIPERIVIRVKFGPSLLWMDVPILVKNLLIKARLRVEMAWSGEYPYLADVSVCTLEKPVIDFALQPLKSVDLMELPKISSWLRELAVVGLGDLMTWPLKLVFPLGVWYGDPDVFGPSVVAPSGDLFVGGEVIVSLAAVRGIPGTAAAVGKPGTQVLLNVTCAGQTVRSRRAELTGAAGDSARWDEGLTVPIPRGGGDLRIDVLTIPPGKDGPVAVVGSYNIFIDAAFEDDSRRWSDLKAPRDAQRAATGSGSSSSSPQVSCAIRVVASARIGKAAARGTVMNRLSSNMKKVANPFRMMRDGVKRAGGSMKNSMRKGVGSSKKGAGASGSASPKHDREAKRKKPLVLDVVVHAGQRLDALLSEEADSATADTAGASEDEKPAEDASHLRFYCEATLGLSSRVTKVSDGVTDPTWDETLSLPISTVSRPGDLKVLVYNIPKKSKSKSGAGAGSAGPAEDGDADDGSDDDPQYLGGVILKIPVGPSTTEPRWHSVFCGTSSCAELKISMHVREDGDGPKQPSSDSPSASPSTEASSGVSDDSASNRNAASDATASVPASVAAAAVASGAVVSDSSMSPALSSSTENRSNPAHSTATDVSDLDLDGGDGGPLKHADDGDTHFIVVDEETPLDEMGSMWGATAVSREPRSTGLGFQIGVINLRRKGRDYLFDVQVITQQNSMWIVSRRYKDFAALAKTMSKKKAAFVRVPPKSEVEVDDPDAWLPLEDMLVAIMSDQPRLVETKTLGVVSKFLQK